MAHIYDYAIIGSGLTGLSIAAALSRETKNIALVEGSDSPYGVNRQVQFPTGPMNNGLRFVPDSVMSEKALRFLESLTGQAMIASVTEVAPITYEAGGFKTFLGFGDSPPDFYEELAYFTAANRIDLSLQPYEWTQLLFQAFRGEFLPRSYVTKFHKEGERISHLTVNGSKTLSAQNFIFTGSIKDLALLLPEDTLSARARSKLAKNLYWTPLCLDVCHGQEVSNSPAMHVLNGTTQDDLGPCVGRFLPSIDTEVPGQKCQSSQWVTFIDHELTDDSESVGLALKKIKRQIKRAYPEALDHVKSERIFVAPMIGGKGDLKVSGNQSLPGLENLWVGSAALNDHKNLVGALLQAEMIIAALGFKLEERPLISTEPLPEAHF